MAAASASALVAVVADAVVVVAMLLAAAEVGEEDAAVAEEGVDAVAVPLVVAVAPVVQDAESDSAWRAEDEGKTVGSLLLMRNRSCSRAASAFANTL